MDDELTKVNQLDDTIPFGIACFHFGIAKEPPFRYKDEQYIAELRKTLESIPNIEHISITNICENQISPQDIEEEISDFPEEVFPNWDFRRIKFSIHIPDRIQQQIQPNARICTERFEIQIDYFFEMPVTFIIPLNPKGECSPADAVIIVRKFLEQQFINIKSEYIRFESLGPSPFHAECYIEPGEDLGLDESSPGFTSKDVTTGAGYDKLIFHYDTGIFENEKDAINYIFHEIISELSFFYEIQRSRLIKMRKWVQIEEMVEDIIPKNKKNGVRSRFHEFIYYSRKIKELFVDLAIFESDSIFSKKATRHDYREIYSDRWASYFRNFVDKVMKEEEETYPTKELIQLLSYLEDQRAKNMELLTIFISAIIGGGIGAFITILMTNK